VKRSGRLPEYPPLSAEDSDRLVALARRFVRAMDHGSAKEKRNARRAFDRFHKAKAVDPVHALWLHVAAVEVARYREERAMG
jgi:hypothetical protein